MNNPKQYKYYIVGSRARHPERARAIWRVDVKDKKVIVRSYNGDVREKLYDLWAPKQKRGRYHKITKEEANRICKSWGHKFG